MAMMMVVIRVAGDDLMDEILNLDQVWVATAEVVSRGWRGWQREVGRTLRIGIIMIISSVNCFGDRAFANTALMPDYVESFFARSHYHDYNR